MRNMLLNKYLAGVMKLVNIGDLKGPDANFVTLPLGAPKASNRKGLDAVLEAAQKGRKTPFFRVNCDRICGAVAGLPMVLSQLIWSL